MDVGMIVALAQASADTTDFERALLDDLMRHVGADVGAVRIGDARPVTCRGFSASFVAAGAQPWIRHAAELDPVLALATRAGSAVDAAVLGEHRVRSSRYFSEVVRPHGGRETCLPSPSGITSASTRLSRGHADVEPVGTKYWFAACVGERRLLATLETGDLELLACRGTSATTFPERSSRIS